MRLLFNSFQRQDLYAKKWDMLFLTLTFRISIKQEMNKTPTLKIQLSGRRLNSPISAEILFKGETYTLFSIVKKLKSACTF